MARILVADDNSNIQKMVGLALKDHGIDVVAVGNGEAAVRKISDIRPDLVLADVFMPVRNGYEVCKYVKDDSSLSHIPVILLVGAFDPLDEQEAQRVGADGVLKKPFVPPDPLISMVKSALMRASTAQAAGVSERATVPAMAGGASATSAMIAPPATFAPAKEEAAVENLVEDIPVKAETLKIDTGGKPLAFGSLLEPEVAEADDAAYATPANPELADRDWNTVEEADEEEEEDDASSSWRRDGGSEDIAAGAGKETAAEKASARKRRESWTPTREKTQNLLEDVAEPDFVAPVKLPAKPSVSTEAVAVQNSVAAKPEPPLTAPKAPEIPAPAIKETMATVISKAPEVAAKAPEITTPAIETAESIKPAGGNSWFSATGSPWEAEAQKATQLASTWDAPTAPTLSEPAPVLEEIPPATTESLVSEATAEAPETYDFISEAPSEEPVHYEPDPGLVQNLAVAHNPLPELISDGSISPETVENIRQETNYALESVTQEVEEKPTASTSKIVETSQADMDALVANVLAKMSPEMLQAVTREILKPVVAAMIRDEITKKS